MDFAKSTQKLLNKANSMDTHEKLRLLYVAATRARDHLIVSGHHKVSKQPDETYAGRLAMFATEHPDLSRRFDPADDVADAVNS